MNINPTQQKEVRRCDTPRRRDRQREKERHRKLEREENRLLVGCDKLFLKP